jgi:hypothetical protein
MGLGETDQCSTEVRDRPILKYSYRARKKKKKNRGKYLKILTRIVQKQKPDHPQVLKLCAQAVAVVQRGSTARPSAPSGWLTRRQPSVVHARFICWLVAPGGPTKKAVSPLSSTARKHRPWFSPTSMYSALGPLYLARQTTLPFDVFTCSGGAGTNTKFKK